jgi:UDP-N-acetylglucosamine--N-acetylmuramyl-(pentapeptide) pyrophosphoryl-undecaprenol N-acetylglucosamine transferase
VLPPLPPPRLLVLGGSQGARQVNELMPATVARLLSRGATLKVLHQAGAKNVEETRAAYLAAGVPDSVVEVVPFLDDIAGTMAKSHLLVSRAGAITVAEICAASRAALFLPLSIAQGHQVDNARLLADAGAAELLTTETATPNAPDLLAERLAALLGDSARLTRMGQAARGLARPGAVAAIADRLAELAENAGRRRGR